MNRRAIGWIIAALGLAFGGLISGGYFLSARGSARPEEIHQPNSTAIPAGGLREIIGGRDAPAISFIDSPSAVCLNPIQNTGVCYIQWSYWYVQASDTNYIITMTVEIDGRQRARVNGFFQTYAYLPGDMFDPGFKVVCGPPEAGGQPELGFSYSYAIRARETGGLTAANYGSVSCPADLAQIYLPVVLR